MRNKKPLSLILVDVDRFKQLNDSQGHLAGDACLKRVAGVLEKAMHRPSDLVARYGGDEFATLIWLDPSSPRRQFFAWVLGRGRVFNLSRPKTALPAWRCPGAFGFVFSDVLAGFGRHPPGESQGNWSRRASLRRLISLIFAGWLPA